MRRLTDTIHEKGMTIVLWWRPMDGGRDSAFSVLAGHVQQASNLLKEHPEYFVKNQNGTFAKLSGPGASNQFNGSTGYALCPYSEGAVQSQVDFVKRAMTEWGIDGFKSDYVWGMPECYNEAHNHKSPKESTEMASEIFYKAIYEEMISINPDAFHLLCNCGTPQDYYSLPYVTQIPTADPTSVDQTRRRVKAYKALAGDDFPITTDHNEIWYPSSVGTGAILIEKRDFAKGSAQEAEYYKWLAIAEEHQLHKGTHIGDLYAYGIDAYETYVIEKDDMMYYSFYKDGNKYRPSGNPEVVLKGLDPDMEYRIEDYVNGRVLAENVSGDEAVFSETFSSYLLLRAIPLEKLEPPAEEKDEVVRLYGTGRYETGYAVADALKEALGVEKFEAVVVATGKNFADALAGSYLAVEKHAPILLTNGKDDNVAQLQAYIKENVTAGGKVYILGGEAAVPASVEAMVGYDVVRLFGDSRYDTSVEEAKTFCGDVTAAVVASGKNFPDGLCGGPLAAALNAPLILTKDGGADAAAGYVADMAIAGGYVLGGDGALTDATVVSVFALESADGIVD